jgi:predicted PurR-regulated permease PerM
MALLDTDKQRAAGLIAILGVALAVALWPFAVGLIGAPVLYVTFAPLYRWLTRRIPASVATWLIIIMALLVIAGPVASIVSLVATQGPEMLRSVVNSPLLDRLTSIRIGSYDVGEQLSQQFRNVGSQLLSHAGPTALAILGSATRLTLQLTIAFFGFYYLLRSPERSWARIRPFVPFSAENADSLRKRFKDVTISTLIGTFLTAAVQGALLGLAFKLAGLANPLFWGVMTTLFAILPVVGSGLIWVPAVVVLYLQGRLLAAILLTIWGIFGVGGVDNLIRPWVYRRYARIHPFITVIGAFAGIAYFGLLGLLIGPLAISYFFELIRMYQEEYLAHVLPPSPEPVPPTPRKRFSIPGFRRADDPKPDPGPETRDVAS